ncbi:MAG TPA: hypothetical protein VHB98_03455 [Chloroflexota bacterium]|nr:hypothetical protein [Chloroflexota bacterium]
MTGDRRGWRVAVVPDALINPPDDAGACASARRLLDALGYGFLQLPSPAGGHTPTLLLAVTADQLAEYAHHGYVAVAVGVRDLPGYGLFWRSLAALLRSRGMPSLPRYVIDRQAAPSVLERELAAFLAGAEISEEEQRRWRA